MIPKSKKTIATIVAHPDDETLWAGGTILQHPSRKIFIACLCRKNDKERALRFYKALKFFKVEGIMGDLDDEPDQLPLDEIVVEQAILKLLPNKQYDLVITHDPSGEYTRHLRHEEISKAVITLWRANKINATELWTFAYEDGDKKYYPMPIKTATIQQKLSDSVWRKKYNIIHKIYEFGKDTWEAKTTPKSEAFWQFKNPHDANLWLTKQEQFSLVNR